MRKIFWASLCLAILSTTASAVELKLGHTNETDHPLHKAAELMAQRIQERTDGRVVIKVFPSGVLGTEGEMLEQTITGGCDFIEAGAGQIANLYKPMAISEMPYIFENNDHAMRFLASPKFQEIKEDFYEQTGGRIVSSSIFGTRHIIGNRAIVTPEDLGDFRLRVPDQRLAVQYAIAMGAKPTPINYGEAYMALQQNVVDGLENPLVSIQSMKFYEVARTLSLTGHVISLVHYVMNDESFSALSSADQQVVLEEFANGSGYILKAMNESDNNLVAFFEKAGLQVVKSDRAAFAAKTKSMSDEYVESWKQFGDLYQYIQNLK
jgi:tripartite ATP-independent transporter DctP family solute receptor